MAKKILIIENDLTMLQILKELLELNNYTIETASTGLEGIQAAEEFKPDLIICDLLLGDISGYEVFSRIDRVYFLFLTGNPTGREWQNFDRSFHLQKPFSVESLIMRIASILNPIG